VFLKNGSANSRKETHKQNGKEDPSSTPPPIQAGSKVGRLTPSLEYLAIHRGGGLSTEGALKEAIVGACSLPTEVNKKFAML